jgi:hypothetical protein
MIVKYPYVGHKLCMFNKKIDEKLKKRRKKRIKYDYKRLSRTKKDNENIKEKNLKKLDI